MLVRPQPGVLGVQLPGARLGVIMEVNVNQAMWVMTLIFAAHWFGDFVFQRHQWSIDKSSSNIALGKHVVTYTLTLFAFFLIILPLEKVLLIAVINGLAHFAIDYVTSRVNRRLWAAERIHDFFVSVGFDQLLHYIVLFYSIFWVVGRV